MKDLIEALQIFLKYGDPKYPTHCEHDKLFIDIDSHLVSQDDKDKLEALGFFAIDDDNDSDGFYSFRFGSC